MTSTTDQQARSVDFEDGLRLIPQLIDAGRYATAKTWARRVIRARPMDPRGWNQLSLTEARLNNFVGAQHLAKIAAMIEPGSADLLVNRGNMTRMRNQHASALALFRKAQVVRPHDPEIDVAVALQLLTVGDYEQGLELYEQRWSRRTALSELESYGVAPWDGEVGSVERLLLVIEQGAGDAIQFVRFADDLSRAGIEVIVYCTDPLLRLLGSAKGVSRAITRMRADMVDAAEMIMSLPCRLGAHRHAAQTAERYLEPPSHPYRIPRAPGRPRVGVCWAGNPNHRRDLQRSCPYGTMATLFDVEGIDFYSLQVAHEGSPVDADPRVTDLADKIDDFADTAGLIDQLDLVITIDSAVAHMAGALNRPCWVLLHWVADWRWGQSGAATDWYSSLSLERRAFAEEWEDFMPRIVERLSRWRDAWQAGGSD